MICLNTEMHRESTRRNSSTARIEKNEIGYELLSALGKTSNIFARNCDRNEIFKLTENKMKPKQNADANERTKKKHADKKSGMTEKRK